MPSAATITHHRRLPTPSWHGESVWGLVEEEGGRRQSSSTSALLYPVCKQWVDGEFSSIIYSSFFFLFFSFFFLLPFLCVRWPSFSFLKKMLIILPVPSMLHRVNVNGIGQIGYPSQQLLVDESTSLRWRRVWFTAAYRSRIILALEQKCLEQWPCIYGVHFCVAGAAAKNCLNQTKLGPLLLFLGDWSVLTSLYHSAGCILQ